MSRCSEVQIPGSAGTMLNPVILAVTTQPDHTSAAAGATRTGRSGLAGAGVGQTGLTLDSQPS